MRGIKRKLAASALPGMKGGGGANADEVEKADYRQNLCDFQTAARQRESIRLKNVVLTNSTPNFWETHLAEKIHVETKMIQGTAKFLSACKNQHQSLEAAKRLQLGRLRLDMLKYELNKLRRGRGSPQHFNSGSVHTKPSYAGVSLSDIRIPLMWKRKDHLNDVGDGRRFAVFCLARIGSQIYDGAMICPVDRSATDINLTDVYLFNKISAHFEVTIEVYARLLNTNNSSSSLVKEAEAILGKTPQKICRTISKAVGKKFLHSELHEKMSSDENQYHNIGPKFELIASATLSLDDISTDVETHELYVVDGSSENCPPLFGAICCRLAALPYCCEEPILTGDIHVKSLSKQSTNNILDLSKSRLVFATLRDWKLRIWTAKSQKETGRRPVLQISINRDTCILEGANNNLTITNRSIDTDETTTWELTFDAENKDYQQRWTVALLQHAADHRRWKRAAEKRMCLGSLAEVGLLSETEEVGPEGKNPKRPKYTKSFKRTRSKLVMLYNQAGDDQDPLI